MFVPGFGMNSFIFRYHPRGGSFMEWLLDAGLDPWSVDLRGQTSSRSDTRKHADVTLEEHANADLPAIFDFISGETGHERVHAIGCSLGGALLYAYAGMFSDHRIDRLVTMGTPLRWVETSPLISAFAAISPAIRAPMKGSRRAAKLALPIATRLAPEALMIYLNPSLTFTTPVSQLVRTVEDPQPGISRQLGQWIKNKDLQLGDLNVTESLKSFTRPLLVVAGNGDRICPSGSALIAAKLAGGPTSSMLIGSRHEQVAHADLFIADIAPERIYRPISGWLTDAEPHSDR